MMLARLRSSYLLPFLVLAVSLATTGVWWFALEAQTDEDARNEFEAEVQQSISAIREQLLGYEDVLQAAAGLVAASDTVSREEWRQFVTGLDLARTYPGIESVNYAVRVRPEEVSALEARMHAEGHESFQVWPMGGRDDYVVNMQVEPAGGLNREALGFDLSSEPIRRSAMERARDSGTVSLSGQLQFFGDRSHELRPGLLLFAPIYRRGSLLASLTERRDALIGYATAGFHVDQLVSRALSGRLLPLGVAIWEGQAARVSPPMYANTQGSAAIASSRATRLSSDIPVTFSGQHWLLRFTASPTAVGALQGSKPLLALITGIPLSLLLFGLTWSEATLRSRATRLANEMTQAVREQAQLLDLTHDTIFLRDAGNIIRYWNRAASDTYGYSAEEAIGRTADDLLKSRYPVPLGQLWADLARHDRWEGEIVHTRRDGTEIIVSSRWAVQRGPDGEIQSILETNNDITDRRRAEEDRRRLEGSLLQAQKLEAMGTLAGGVAHDFNNILGAILGYGELAQDAAPAGGSLRRYVDNVMSAGQRAKSLVERILAFSRSSVAPRVPVHVQSVVAEAIELLSASMPSSIRLERELLAGDAAVAGDATQIHQVVLNLCTNAIQAMKSGGVLSVRLDVLRFENPPGVVAGVLAAGEYVRLSVRDTGTGIDPDLRGRIFDPFFTTKGVGVGTGLGLSLVHGIAVDLGGGVNMESEVGRGTTFTVYLPCSGRTKPTNDGDEPLARGNGEAVMIVDDEETLVQLGEEMIAALGYEPVGFHSPAAALEAFRKDPERFAAVLSDETMPGMTGTQLTAQLLSIRADTPIVLMSGYASAALAARARSVGARDVLSKPLNSRDIARVLANLVGARSPA